MTLARPPFPAVLDSSIMSAWRACRQKFALEHLHHWKPEGISVHLHAGAAYAAGLEAARTAFYSNSASSSDAVALGVNALLKHYGDFSCPPDSAKSAVRTAGALEFYFDRYPLDEDRTRPILLPSGKHAIEFGFAEPLLLNHPQSGDPLIYCGRMDMVCERDGMTLGEDDKTTTQLGASWPRQWDLRCFSPEHELYTRSGWQPISCTIGNTEILQSDREGNLSFTQPTKVTCAAYNGQLIHITGRRLSQCVTPNHRILLNRRRGGTTTVFAEDLSKQDDKHTIPLAGRHTEERLPAALQRFIVAVQADAKLQESKGRVTKGQGHREHMPNRAIAFGFTKERKVARLKEVLNELTVRYTYRDNERNEFYISGFEPITELVDMILDENKDFKQGYETLFDDNFLNELEYWDGWNNQYYTNSANNAKFVSTVAALNDRAASVSCDTAGHWTVVLSQDTQRTLKSASVTSMPYEGNVYCVTVPAGYVLTRLNGDISISGNSQFTGYCWGAAKNGLKLDGFLIRGVSILKTKYDTLEAITYRPAWQIERWLTQLYRDLREMLKCWEEGYFDYNLDESCNAYGGCLFKQVCLMHDPQPLLEQQFQRRRWNPLKREEIVL